MSTMVYRKRNDAMEADIVKQFRDVDTSDFPDFYSYTRILDKGLWVLWVTKETLGRRRLTASEISSIIRDVKEVSIYPMAIAQHTIFLKINSSS